MTPGRQAARALSDIPALLKEQSPYRQPEDWVFASRHSHGEQPYWGQAILHKYLRPVARDFGIKTRFGWHTFRHTYSTLLRSVGTEFDVMQELLRHSTMRSTPDVYTQAITPAKQNAQAADKDSESGGSDLPFEKVLAQASLRFELAYASAP
jgi:integrase